MLVVPDLFAKPVTIEFDQRQGSSDGGAVLLKATGRRYDLVRRLNRSLIETRQEGKIDRSLAALTAQRIYAIACGYADANDAARLKADSVHKMLVGRDPNAGFDLASQPSLSRFENAASPRQLYRTSEQLAVSLIERYGKRLGGHAKRVTIDLDPTDDPSHGAQQLSFFNSHYDNSCYLPVIGFVSFDHEADQYLCAAVLRPGNVTATAGAVGILPCAA